MYIVYIFVYVYICIYINIYIYIGGLMEYISKKSCMWGHGYQNSVKRVLWVHFWRNFWKIFKNEGFGPKFWDTQYKIFFFFYQKNLFTTPIWIIFRYYKNFFSVLGSLRTPMNKIKKLCVWGHGYHNGVNRVRWVHFWSNFWKIFKNEGVGPKFWDTQYKKLFLL